MVAMREMEQGQGGGEDVRCPTWWAETRRLDRLLYTYANGFTHVQEGRVSCPMVVPEVE